MQCVGKCSNLADTEMPVPMQMIRLIFPHICELSSHRVDFSMNLCWVTLNEDVKAVTGVYRESCFFSCPTAGSVNLQLGL